MSNSKATTTKQAKIAFINVEFSFEIIFTGILSFITPWSNRLQQQLQNLPVRYRMLYDRSIVYVSIIIYCFLCMFCSENLDLASIVAINIHDTAVNYLQQSLTSICQILFFRLYNDVNNVPSRMYVHNVFIVFCELYIM